MFEAPETDLSITVANWVAYKWLFLLHPSQGRRNEGTGANPSQPQGQGGVEVPKDSQE